MNPAYGQALERARGAESSSRQLEPPQQASDAHWVTINGRHVLMGEGQAERAKRENQRHHKQAQIIPGQPNTKDFSGDATYYDLPGRNTASGQIFDPNKMAAAMTSEKARLGQIVLVTYTYKDPQGNSVTRTISVQINDRGPFARDAKGKATLSLQPAPGKVIDLTPAAFKQLVGTTKPGHVPVTVKVPDD